MNFETYHKSVVSRSLSFSSAARTFARRPILNRKFPELNGAKARKVTSAAVLVINERGEEWCRRHPQQFESEVLSRLGTVANIAITILGFFSGGGIWMTLAKILIPAVITLLNDRARWMKNSAFSISSSGEARCAGDLSGLAAEAEQNLKGG